MSVAAGQICAQYSREEEGSEDLPSRRCVRENDTGRGSRPADSWVSSLAGDDRVNDAPSPLHTPAKGIRPDL